MKFDSELYRHAVELRPWAVCEADVLCINELLAMGFDHRAENLTQQSLQALLHGPTTMFVVRLRTDTQFGPIVSMATLCQMTNLYGHTGMVHHVATHMGHVRRGLALEVMKRLLAQADGTPMVSVALTCSAKRTGAREIYESLGFHNITDTVIPGADRMQVPEPETALFRRDHPKLSEPHTVISQPLAVAWP